MAKKGIRYCCFGIPGNTWGLSNGKWLSPVAKIGATVRKEIVQDYYDGKLCASEQMIVGGEMLLELNRENEDIYDYLLGHGKETTSDGKGTAFNTDDTAPVVSVGVYGYSSGHEDGKNWVVKIYKMVKFREPDDKLETRKENVDFIHLELTGDMMIPASGNWKEEYSFLTEAEAKWYLETRFAVTNSGQNLFINTLYPDVSTGSKLPRLIGQTTDTVYSSNSIVSVAEHGFRVTANTDMLRPLIRFGSNTVVTASMNGLVAGETYTFSCTVKFKLLSSPAGMANTGNQVLRARFYYIVQGGSGFEELYYTIAQLSNANQNKGVEVSTDMTWTFEIPDTTIGCYIIIRSAADSSFFAEGDFIELSNIKLETGDTATPWIPANTEVE